MINEEEKFDDLLRTKMSEREFFFDELNWDEAEKLIKRGEKLRQLKRLSIVLASGIAIGVVITVPLMNMLTTNRINKALNSSSLEGSAAVKETKSQPVTAGNIPAKPSESNSNSNKNPVASTTANNASAASQNNEVISNTVAAASAPANLNAAERDSKEHTQNTNRANSNIAGNVSHSSSRNNSTFIEANTPSVSKNANRANNSIASINKSANITKTIKELKNGASASSHTIASATTAYSQNTNSPKVSGLSSNKISNQATDKASNTANPIANNTFKNTTKASSPLPAKTASATNASESKSASNSTADNRANNEQTSTTQPANNSNADKTANNIAVTTTPSSQLANTAEVSNKNTNANNTSTAATINSLTKETTQNSTKKTTDSASTKTEGIASTESLPPIERKTVKGTMQLSIDAGGNYAFGWNNSGTKEGNGISPLFGITGTRFFGSKISLSLGAQFNELTNLKTGYTHSTTTYGFGYSYSDTTVTPTTAYYIGVPLTLQYHFDDKNAICLGASMLLLLDVNSNVSTTTQTNSDNGPTTKSQAIMGYTSGFSTNDIQLRLAYRRKIWKGFSVTAEGYYGLMDIEEAPYFSNTSAKNNGFRLILSYNLIDR